MILENKVIEILKEDNREMFKIGFRSEKWINGLYEKTAKRIVKMIKEELVK